MLYFPRVISLFSLIHIFVNPCLTQVNVILAVTRQFRTCDCPRIYCEPCRHAGSGCTGHDLVVFPSIWFVFVNLIIGSLLCGSPYLPIAFLSINDPSLNHQILDHFYPLTIPPSVSIDCFIIVYVHYSLFRSYLDDNLTNGRIFAGELAGSIAHDPGRQMRPNTSNFPTSLFV